MTKYVGILSEFYNIWERRVPLTPTHVQELIQNGINVIVQPSTSRIYSDEQYKAVGADISMDISKANLLIGVKQVPSNEILPEKTYMFFSHTIKGQMQNMEILDTILQKKVTLLDYECIRQGGEQNGKRIIAFGKNAGQTGMVNSLRGLGERLIHLGYSTPFINIASMYMYSDLQKAKEAVITCGNRIKLNGLPESIVPLTFVFTGNGNVSKGAQEIFSLLPHQMVDPSELGKLPADRHTVYGTVVEHKHMVQRKDNAGPFSRSEYYSHPELYNGCFHQTIAPHASMIVNSMYWDNRFPPLLTREHLLSLNTSGNRKLLGIADLSCDIKGSIEFLKFSTTIEKPFTLYEPSKDKMYDSLEGDGIFMMAIDILPSELALESTEQFGDKLLPYVKLLSTTDSNASIASNKELPIELRNACIASGGMLMPQYEYINKIRQQTLRSEQMLHRQSDDIMSCSTCLQIDGHLFDTGLINDIFDKIEQNSGHFYLVDCQVRPNFTSNGSKSTSSAIIQISMNTRAQLEEIYLDIENIARNTTGAEAFVKNLPHYCRGNYSRTDRAIYNTKDKAVSQNYIPIDNSLPVLEDQTHIVCLGAGLVASPLVEYLSRDPKVQIHVVSGVEDEAERIRDKLRRNFGRTNIMPYTMDVTMNIPELNQLYSKASCIVSLLPAFMHVSIAKRCINLKTPLVTASYITPEMHNLNDEAKCAGIPILCELGLDPGIDHMSAMKVIERVKHMGGKILSFSSVCGGLPAPEFADNLIGYKFSWSPKGVLLAALNSATYLKNNEIVKVNGEDLLQSNKRADFLPAFALEQIPNRNSLPYCAVYGISDAHSIFRGTLRYAGYCNILYQLRLLGLFDNVACPNSVHTWVELIQYMLSSKPNITLDKSAVEFLHWLGIYDNKTPFQCNVHIIDAFCTLLQQKLSYNANERDMVIMHHEFGVEFPSQNGLKESVRNEKWTSTYVGYGSTSPEGDTIMAKTVGITAGIGVKLILEGAVANTGVLTPTTSDIFIPAMNLLEQEGILFKENIQKQSYKKNNCINV